MCEDEGQGACRRCSVVTRGPADCLLGGSLRRGDTYLEGGQERKEPVRLQFGWRDGEEDRWMRGTCLCPQIIIIMCNETFIAFLKIEMCADIEKESTGV